MAQAILPTALMSSMEMEVVDGFSLHVGMMVDDSSSIAESGLTAAVREGHNGVLDMLTGPAEPLPDASAGPVDPTAVVPAVAPRPPTFVRTTLMNRGPLSDDYRPVSAAIRLDANNYRPNGGTPLCDATLQVLLGAETLAASQPGARTVTCVMTDGEENASSHTVDDVRLVVERMLASGRHIVYGLGVGHETTFRGIFSAMGIPDRFIVVVAATEQGVQEGMHHVGHASCRASHQHDP